jgi:hypothetical protein
MISDHDIAIARRELIHAAFQTFQLLLVNLRVWTCRHGDTILLQAGRLALPEILPPDILGYSEAISQRAGVFSQSVNFSNYYVNRLIEQVVRI